MFKQSLLHGYRLVAVIALCLVVVNVSPLLARYSDQDTWV